MDTNEVACRALILHLIQSNNHISAPELQRGSGFNRGRIVELTNEMEEAGLISKTKRLINSDLMTCYNLTSKGFDEYYEYQLKIKDHVGDPKIDDIPYQKFLLSVLDKGELVEQYFDNTEE